MTRFGAAVATLQSDDSVEVLDAVIDAAQDADIHHEDVAALTKVIAASGDTLPRTDHAVDIASSGAPGSLTTLLAPLVASASGIEIRKITVPGRPAGSVDVLMTLPGYRSDLTR